MQGHGGISGSDRYQEVFAVPQTSRGMLEVTYKGLVRITALLLNTTDPEMAYQC